MAKSNIMQQPTQDQGALKDQLKKLSDDLAQKAQNFSGANYAALQPAQQTEQLTDLKQILTSVNQLCNSTSINPLALEQSREIIIDIDKVSKDFESLNTKLSSILSHKNKSKDQEGINQIQAIQQGINQLKTNNIALQQEYVSQLQVERRQITKYSREVYKSPKTFDESFNKINDLLSQLAKAPVKAALETLFAKADVSKLDVPLEYHKQYADYIATFVNMNQEINNLNTLYTQERLSILSETDKFADFNSSVLLMNKDLIDEASWMRKHEKQLKQLMNSTSLHGLLQIAEQSNNTLILIFSNAVQIQGTVQSHKLPISLNNQISPNNDPKVVKQQNQEKLEQPVAQGGGNHKVKKQQQAPHNPPVKDQAQQHQAKYQPPKPHAQKLLVPLNQPAQYQPPQQPAPHNPQVPLKQQAQHNPPVLPQPQLPKAAAGIAGADFDKEADKIAAKLLQQVKAQNDKTIAELKAKSAKSGKETDEALAQATSRETEADSNEGCKFSQSSSSPKSNKVIIKPDTMPQAQFAKVREQINEVTSDAKVETVNEIKTNILTIIKDKHLPYTREALEPIVAEQISRELPEVSSTAKALLENMLLGDFLEQD
jgi:hypothetical protein